MEVFEAIEKLRKDPDIVITGPDYSDKNKLRVYAKGGLIGKIFVGTHSNGKSELINPDYFRYYKANGPGQSLEGIVSSSKDALVTLCDAAYIRACKNALTERYEKKTDEGEKERHVQTRIVKHFMNQGTTWCVIDMEMQCPSVWFKDANFSEGTTDQPRFDMIVLNHDGIGVIELKVDNENTKNMESHYEHMAYLLQNEKAQDCFIKEIQRRIGIMEKNGLLCQNAGSFPQDRIWCGFLFVGGGTKGLQGSIELAESLRKKDFADRLRFLYCQEYSSDEAIQSIDINKAHSLEDFIKQ